jgi:hypothetical protein
MSYQEGPGEIEVIALKERPEKEDSKINMGALMWLTPLQIPKH